jgi:hypothetical protein
VTTAQVERTESTGVGGSSMRSATCLRTQEPSGVSSNSRQPRKRRLLAIE